MVATVRLDDEIERTLNKICDSLHKKKSDVIRDAIVFYAGSLENKKKSRMKNAIDKVSEGDYGEYLKMEDSINDGL